MPLPFKRLLVAVDFSDTAATALTVARAIHARGASTQLTILHALESLDDAPTDAGYEKIVESYGERAAAEAEERLEALAGALDGSTRRIQTRVGRGQPAEVIVAQADGVSADLVIVGTHGHRGVRRLLFGSVAGEVLRSCRRPVLTVPIAYANRLVEDPVDAASAIEVTRILVPTDFSDDARAGLRMGLELAVGFGAELHLLHVVDSRSGDALEPLLGDRQENVRNLLGHAQTKGKAVLAREVAALGPGADDVSTHEHVRLGTPSHEIEELVRGGDVDLVVMGSRGRTGVGDFLLGSTAERVSRACPVPVLTVRA